MGTLPVCWGSALPPFLGCATTNEPSPRTRRRASWRCSWSGYSGASTESWARTGRRCVPGSTKPTVTSEPSPPSSSEAPPAWSASSSIWTQCGRRTEPLQAQPWRVVEDQSRSSTRVLVDSAADHQELEEMLEASKPAAPREPVGLSYLLWTPFRYPPLKHGSRFGTKLEGGLWYGSDRLETALAETAYYKLLFLEGPERELGAIKPRLSAFQASVATARGADLSRAPFAQFRPQISAKDAYALSQRLGSEMRADAVEACRYFSARDRGEGTNLVLFTPKAFSKKT